jgi:hypothetical protein
MGQVVQGEKATLDAMTCTKHAVDAFELLAIKTHEVALQSINQFL